VTIPDEPGRILGDHRHRSLRRAEPGRTPTPLPRVVHLLVVVAVAVPAAWLGVSLGLSSTSPTAGGPAQQFRLPGPIQMQAPSASPTDTAGPVSAASSPTPTAGSLSPSSPSGPASGTPLLVDNFDSGDEWARHENDLGEWSGADTFVNRNGAVAAGALMLVYHDDGWFGSDVNRDVSGYRYLVLRVAGARGGEQGDFTLALGGVKRRFSEFALDGGATPVITTSFQDIRLPLAANGINQHRPGELELSFWYGGNSTLLIEEIRFE
jgi:hypothetical protein